jgi:transcriptional regulator with XRE-family HTH domain
MKKLNELINDLFETHRKPNGERYTNKEVSEALGGKLDHSHLSLLRNGKSLNPGRLTLLRLCQFFKVSPTYFFPELDEQTEQPASSKETGTSLRLRAPRNLSEKAQQRLNAFLESLNEDAEDAVDDAEEAADDETE